MWHKCVGAGQCILFTSRPPRPPEFPGDHLSTSACTQREAIKTHIIHWKTNTISLTAPQRISTHTHTLAESNLRANARAVCTRADFVFDNTAQPRRIVQKPISHTKQYACAHNGAINHITIGAAHTGVHGRSLPAGSAGDNHMHD